MSRLAVAAEIGDPEGTRTVLAIIALLVVMGLGLVMLAVWLRRSTRPDPEFLAPLEVMGERTWRRRDPVWQRRRLDEVRPAGAEPMRRSAEPPRVDEAFDAGPTAIGFDDLRHDGDLRRQVVTPGGADDDVADGVGSPGTPLRSSDGAGAGDGSDDRDGDAPDDRDADRDADRDDAAAEVLGHTPIATNRPLLDELPPDGVDPELVRQAMEELDAELHGRSNQP